MWTEENNGPIVVIFHGLTGSADSQYARCLMHTLNEKGVRAVLMHFRGCSGEPNKTRGSYHSGDTRDISFVIDTVAKRYPDKPLAAAGFSLGFREKKARYPQLNLDEIDIDSVENFFEFDHHITAPLHGYKSCADYYQKASTLTDLINIKTPTHILWAADDPFFSEKCIPTNDQLSDAVHFELATHGGHVAFISGNIPLRGHNWLCERVSGLLAERLIR